MAEIGKLIKEYRRINNVTQESFGELVGVNKKTVSKWENGIQNPSIEKYYEIVQIIGIPYDTRLATDEESDNILIFQHRIRYDVGLNALYRNVHDFQSFAWFIDAINEAKNLVSPDDPLNGFLLKDSTFDENKNGIPILSLDYDYPGISIETPEGNIFYLSKDNFASIKLTSSFNNESYSFIVYLENEEEDFLQLILGFSTEDHRMTD